MHRINCQKLNTENFQNHSEDGDQDDGSKLLLTI